MSTRRSRRPECSGRTSLSRLLVVTVVGLLVLTRVPAAGAATLHVTGTVPFFDLCEVQNIDANQECYIYANLLDAPTNVSVVQTEFDEDAGTGTVKVTWEAPSLTNDQEFVYIITWTGDTTGEDTAPSSVSEATVSGLVTGEYAFTVRLAYTNPKVPIGDLSEEFRVTIPAPVTPASELEEQTEENIEEQLEGKQPAEEEAGSTDIESDDDPE